MGEEKGLANEGGLGVIVYVGISIGSFVALAIIIGAVVGTIVCCIIYQRKHDFLSSFGSHDGDDEGSVTATGINNIVTDSRNSSNTSYNSMYSLRTFAV